MTREEYIRAILRKTAFDRKTKKRLEAGVLSLRRAARVRRAA